MKNITGKKPSYEIKIFLSSIFIILAFFLGYFFNKEISKISLENIKNQKSYINLEIKEKKINITNLNKNIIILVNGEETSSGKIVLEY